MYATCTLSKGQNGAKQHRSYGAKSRSTLHIRHPFTPIVVQRPKKKSLREKTVFYDLYPLESIFIKVSSRGRVGEKKVAWPAWQKEPKTSFMSFIGSGAAIRYGAQIIFHKISFSRVDIYVYTGKWQSFKIYDRLRYYVGSSMCRS